MLVEDDEVDAMTVKRALKDLNVTNELIHKINGEEALEYLRNDAEKKPCVILLDLNMPKMNGIEFLKIAKNNEQLKKIPVTVLTTSTGERNIVESFEFSVAGYIVKPVDYGKFVEAIRVINLYWTLSELPLCEN
jgi:CheY-like chemotaxis protein